MSTTTDLLSVYERLQAVQQLMHDMTRKGQSLMATIDDLNNAIAALASDVTTIVADLNTEIAALAAANSASTPNPAIEASVTNLNALSAQLAAAIAAVPAGPTGGTGPTGATGATGP
jgi:hypothetical protein